MVELGSFINTIWNSIYNGKRNDHSRCRSLSRMLVKLINPCQFHNGHHLRTIRRVANCSGHLDSQLIYLSVLVSSHYFL